MLNRYVLILTGLCAVAACTSKAAEFEPVQEIASAQDEADYRKAIVAKIRVAVEKNDYRTLAAMEETFRTSRSRTMSGYWDLGLYHAALRSVVGEGITSEKGCISLKADFVMRWKEAEPKSPAPIIAEADMLEAQGWCYRGNGFAESVPSTAWPKFKRSLQLANEVLETHKKTASVNPEYYAVKASIYRGLGVPQDQFESLLDEASKNEPAYFRTYFAAVWYYMPQWGGSFEAVDRFARYAATQSEKTDGTGAYARIYWHLEACDCDIIRQAAAWPTLKASMIDIYKRYPVGRNREFFMKASCKMEQPQTTLDFAKMAFPDKSKEDHINMMMQSCEQAARERK